MTVSVALWSMEVKPGDPVEITPPADLKITNVALGDEVADDSGRTTLKITYRTPGASAESDNDEEVDIDDKVSTTVLCSLTCGKIEQATVEVTLMEEEEYLFEVVGKNTLYLTGNYIDQRPMDEEPFSDEEEDDFDVSSDAEELDVPSDDDADRFEEIVEDDTNKETSKKRPRESDAMDTDEKVSKSQKKKQKKLKGANGEAVEAPSPEKQEEKKEKKEKGEKKAKAEVKTIQGGVQVADHKTGTGPQAKPGDMVSVRYIGKLQNGKIFDQNIKGKAFQFRLGKGEVIKGWDVGVAGMQAGGERLLTIPAPMAYGKKSQPGIPANSTLTFEVKLLQIK